MGIPPSGVKAGRFEGLQGKAKEINQIFKGRTEGCPANQGAPVASPSAKGEGRRGPVPSFSAPGGWRIPSTGSR